MSQANIDAGAAPPAQTEPNHFRRAFIVWVVLSLILIVIWVVLAPYILPPSASDLDVTNDLSIVVFTALAIPVALFVFVFIGYSLVIFRVRERPEEDPIPLKPRPMLEIGWLGITGGLCLFLLIWSLVAFYQNTAASASNPLIVQVTGQQWFWSFNYPQYSAASQSQVIELPVNRPVEFVVTSKDVLHGFAIRSLGMRVDANPGETTTTPIVIPTRIGQYTVNCVELCGLYHSYMWEAVNVVDVSSFNSWITSQGGHP